MTCAGVEDVGFGVTFKKLAKSVLEIVVFCVVLLESIFSKKAVLIADVEAVGAVS